MKSSARFLTLFVVLSLAATAPASAQSTGHYELREIIVTAEKISGNAERDGSNKLPDAVISAFLASNQVTLYAIEESESGNESIHGYKVLGKARIKKSETAALFADLQQSLTKDYWGSMCFHPHHVLRAEVSGHTYDMVICYLCGLVVSYEMDSSPEGTRLAGNSLDGSPDLINGIAKKHGLPIPLVLIREEAWQKKTRRDYAQFLTAAPQSIRVLFPHNINPRANNPSPDNHTMQEALAQQYPNTQRQIVALFAWNGSLPWNGLSSFEDSVPGDLLRAYAFADLLSKAQSDQLTDSQLAGAAKFFTRSSIREQDEHDRQALSDAIKNYSKDIDSWSKAMPAAIRPLWKDEMWYYEGGFRLSAADDKLMQQALVQEFADKNARILSLFGWYGSGPGVQRNTSGYENIVHQLLCDFTTPELAHALQATTLSEQQLDGAARLFAHWEYQRDRKGEVKELPPALKATLLTHIKDSGNEFWNKYTREFE